MLILKNSSKWRQNGCQIENFMSINELFWLDPVLTSCIVVFIDDSVRVYVPHKESA